MYDDGHFIFSGRLPDTEPPAYAPSKLERFGKWLIGVPADCDPAREKTLRQAKRNREAAIEHEMKAHECTFDTISKRLKDALDMVEDCGKLYCCANDA